MKGKQRRGGRKNNRGQVIKAKCSSRWNLAFRLRSVFSAPVSVSQPCGSPPLPASTAVTAYQHCVNVSLYRPWLCSPTHQGEGGRNDQGGTMPTVDSTERSSKTEERRSKRVNYHMANILNVFKLHQSHQSISTVVEEALKPADFSSSTCRGSTTALTVAWEKSAFNEDGNRYMQMLTRAVSPCLWKLLIRLETFV